MKKYLILIGLPVLVLMGCYKGNNNECVPIEETAKAPDPEINTLKGYLIGNGITTTADPRGFFYNISTTGTGAKPNSCSTVGLDYVARLLNGTTVDSNNNVFYQVNQFITGWKEALPLLPAGSVMTLYVPPSLAYGPTANRNVPANSNLVFYINLKSVN